MPHPDNSNWMSMLMGRPVKLERPTSPDDIPARREKFDLSVANTEPLPDVAETHRDVFLRERRDASKLTADVYVPHGQPPFPTLVYLHGSMFCLASAWDFRKLTRRYAAQGFCVIVVDYALAPERPFPWAVEDCVYALRWAVANAERFGGDPRRILVAGDSAGANLGAAAIAYLTGNDDYALDEGDLANRAVDLTGALFFYGIYDFPLLMQEPFSNVGSIEVMANRAYLGPHYLTLHRNPLVSPALADVSRFPPTYVTAGAEDSFMFQSLSLAKALALANVPVSLSVVQATDHSFAQLDHLIPQAAEEMQRAFTWLRRTAGLEGFE
jgi:acetyl esterase